MKHTVCLLGALAVLVLAGRPALAAEVTAPDPASAPSSLEKVPSGETAAPDEKEDQDNEKKEAPSAGELAEGIRDTLSDKIQQCIGCWTDALEALSENKTMGWLVGMAVLVLGLLLLGFGWAVLKALFVPFTAVLGMSCGAFFALQVAVGMMPESGGGTKLILLAIGAVFGLVLFLGCAIKAPPIAWMLVAMAPFMIISVFVFPISPTTAVVTTGLGLAFGLASSMRRRALTIISTSLLGALGVAFCWGLFTYLLAQEALLNLFEEAVARPFVVAGAVLLIVFIGSDVQFILGPVEDEAES